MPSKAMCVYLETDFHDNKEIAKWIVNNTTAIGEAIAKEYLQNNKIKWE